MDNANDEIVILISPFVGSFLPVLNFRTRKISGPEITTLIQDSTLIIYSVKFYIRQKHKDRNM